MGFGCNSCGNSCSWVLILIIILFLVGGVGNCGCPSNNCGNDCGCGC